MSGKTFAFKFRISSKRLNINRPKTRQNERHTQKHNYVQKVTEKAHGGGGDHGGLSEGPNNLPNAEFKSFMLLLSQFSNTKTKILSKP